MEEYNTVRQSDFIDTLSQPISTAFKSWVNQLHLHSLIIFILSTEELIHPSLTVREL